MYARVNQVDRRTTRLFVNDRNMRTNNNDEDNNNNNNTEQHYSLKHWRWEMPKNCWVQ